MSHPPPAPEPVECDMQFAVGWNHSLPFGPARFHPALACTAAQSQLSALLKALAATSVLMPSQEPALLRYQVQSIITVDSMLSFPSLPNPALLFSQFALSISGTCPACPFFFALACAACHQDIILWPYPYSNPGSKTTSLGELSQ